MAQSDNAELLARVVAGDTTAWSELVDRYLEPVWRVTGNYRLDQATREDVVQTTWLRLFDKASTIREPDRLGGWLCRVARNEAINVVRQQSRVMPGTSASWAADVSNDIEDLNPDADSEQRLLLSALDGLDEDCKALLTLCFHEPPLARADIAVSLNIRKTDITSKRERCLHKMRRHAGIAQLILDHRERTTHG